MLPDRPFLLIIRSDPVPRGQSRSQSRHRVGPPGGTSCIGPTGGPNCEDLLAASGFVDFPLGASGRIAKTSLFIRLTNHRDGVDQCNAIVSGCHPISVLPHLPFAICPLSSVIHFSPLRAASASRLDAGRTDRLGRNQSVAPELDAPAGSCLLLASRKIPLPRFAHAGMIRSVASCSGFQGLFHLESPNR